MSRRSKSIAKSDPRHDETMLLIILGAIPLSVLCVSFFMIVALMVA